MGIWFGPNGIVLQCIIRWVGVCVNYPTNKKWCHKQHLEWNDLRIYFIGFGWFSFLSPFFFLTFFLSLEMVHLLWFQMSIVRTGTPNSILVHCRSRMCRKSCNKCNFAILFFSPNFDLKYMSGNIHRYCGQCRRAVLFASNTNNVCAILQMQTKNLHLL